MIQIYTGTGKGKTTAALGLSLRALGWGLRVCLVQFMKKRETGEIKALKKFKNLTIKQFGQRSFVNLKKPGQLDKISAQKALKYAERIVISRKYHLVILDEINIAVKYKLIPLAKVMRLFKNISLSTELVLTGRSAHARMIKQADLVTEMKEVKHYFRQGLKARKGIEY